MELHNPTYNSETNKQDEQLAAEKVDKFILSFGDEKIEDYKGLFYNENKSIGLNLYLLLKDFASDFIIESTEDKKRIELLEKELAEKEKELSEV